MIDKIIIMETGKVPTEAQYWEMGKNYGLQDVLNKQTGKLMEGAKLPERVRQQILSEADEQMKLAHQGYDISQNEFKDKATANQIDPSKVFQAGGAYKMVNGLLDPASNTPAPSPGNSSGSSAAPKSGVAKPQSASDFNSLPIGSLWQDSQGVVHRKLK